MQAIKPKAFTLIELLVALAVIAILAALLLPVFGRVRENARRATCQSNLQQLALAMQQYVADSDGQYPLKERTENRNGVNYGVASWRDNILPYTKDARIAHCPDYPYDSPVDEDYAFNYRRLNTYHPQFPSYTITGTHESVLKTPATTWLNSDQGWSFSAYPGAPPQYHDERLVTTSCGRHFFGSTLHGGSANYSFLDGHVRWLSPEAMGEIDCANEPMQYPFNLYY